MLIPMFWKGRLFIREFEGPAAKVTEFSPSLEL